MDAKDLSIRMTGFNNTRNAATISFLSPKGDIKSVFIHRETFYKLMSGKLEKDQTPGMSPSLDQMELREALNKEIGREYVQWFDTSANELLRKEANARSTYSRG